ncbi:phage/plasmid primase, P4 family [Mycobacteroides abscessus]|uniref:phage/plasmid primase, P4 family n=1 Tax=Mycobacteroides abscessus TaxID=36809 RepID=UPI00092A4142|nr:phage/plasmid primase, P4 family [Mycobacteroides abscessus]MDM3900428.1 phage/plasmid primase, P4 family [Mycobacteroides abscessus]SHP06125.1 bacteriophage protein [Mycobacteroides abscessus subsp. abscessus]SHQ44470.1 bacteriophage protein [Mycobacteroides abscessus subsp. abscessus]SHQ86579.1 bacteriophage protein [Mycobacteroides abscessus subsp. abscessus]SHQ95838.1 bacteriophage protein [Mycobacteroides abscessus subsp. abscessus]
MKGIPLATLPSSPDNGQTKKRRKTGSAATQTAPARSLPDVTGMSCREAAGAYAAVGIRVVPVPPATKDPGRYLGKAWQHQASADPERIAYWWDRWPDAGVGIVPGQSGLLVVDIDHAERGVPAWLQKHLDSTVFRCSDTVDSAHGHYFFALRDGQKFRNSWGAIKMPKAGRIGDIKSDSGFIVVAPTEHARPEGHYSPVGGDVAYLPDAIAEKLSTATDSAVIRSDSDKAKAAEVFIATYDKAKDADALDAITASFETAAGGRHASMFDCLCWAAREAKAGCFPATDAIDELKALWCKAIGGESRDGDGDEFERMVRDAIAAADADGTPEQLWDRAHRDLWPSPNSPDKVAERILARVNQGDAEDRRPLVYWRKQWLRFDGACYRALDDEEIRCYLYELLGGVAFYMKGSKRVPWNPDKSRIDKVVDVLKAKARISVREMPSWLDDAEARGGDDRARERVIACANGLLRISDRELLAHTPDYFTTMALDFDYCPDIAEPKRWLRFLTEIFGTDQEAIDSISALQEWFGYLLSGRTDLQKMLMLIGPPRSGKGTIDKIITHLIGRDNHMGMTAREFTSPFGMAALKTKSLAVFSDERMAANGKQFVEQAIQIIGEDEVSVAEKYKGTVSMRLPTRLMLMSNEVPTLPDASRAITKRLIVLEIKNSFYQKEDIGLLAALKTELSAILTWALDGLDRLTEVSKFTETNSALLGLLDEGSSPISQFVDEKCVLSPEARIPKDRLYDAWRLWCQDNGHTAGSKASLTKKLRAAFGDQINQGARVGGAGEQVRSYGGIRLRRADGSALAVIGSGSGLRVPMRHEDSEAEDA